MIKWYKPTLYLEGRRLPALSVVSGVRVVSFDWTSDGLKVIQSSPHWSVTYADDDVVRLTGGLLLPWSRLCIGQAAISLNDRHVAVCTVEETDDLAAWQAFISDGLSAGTALYDLHLTELQLLRDMTLENYRIFNDRIYEYHQKNLIDSEQFRMYLKRDEEYRIKMSFQVSALTGSYAQMKEHEQATLSRAQTLLYEDVCKGKCEFR